MAGIRIILYTITASLPLLTSLVLINREGVYTFFTLYRTVSTEIRVRSKFLFFSFVFAFLVKFPLFLVHLWLPKAHVEAPVMGSIVLAALLLKLGGYGMILFRNFYQLTIWTNSVISFALYGGIVMAFLRIRQKDIKVLIAYSSVCHMALVISCVLTQNN